MLIYFVLVRLSDEFMVKEFNLLPIVMASKKDKYFFFFLETKSYTGKHRTRVWVHVLPFGYLRRLQWVSHLAMHMSTGCSQMSKIINLAISYMYGKQAIHNENKIKIPV